MRILIEAHHPAHTHFWKFPARRLIQDGHQVRMIGRDRDVMKRLLNVYNWIPTIIPRRKTFQNRFPVAEMIHRQATVAMEISRFRPDVVASLMGSYCQTAKIVGVRNVVFTDSEFQHFNHRIAHPFADEIHTPYCFYKPLGAKQHFYKGIHELAFLDGRRFTPDPEIPKSYGLLPKEYIVIRLSAWNTFHDIQHKGMGDALMDFVNRFKNQFRIVISAEEDQLPDPLKSCAMPVPPDKFHDVLAFARFVLTEGASTASEAACLGVPTVYINSTEPRGYLQMLERDYGLVRNSRSAKGGIPCAIEWLARLDDTGLNKLRDARRRMIGDHCDVCRYVVDVLENGGQG